MKEFHFNASTGTQRERLARGKVSTQYRSTYNYTIKETTRIYPKVEQAEVSGSTSAGTRYFRPRAPWAL
jgi:hypothetical protein